MHAVRPGGIEPPFLVYQTSVLTIGRRAGLVLVRAKHKTWCRKPELNRRLSGFNRALYLLSYRNVRLMRARNELS